MNISRCLLSSTLLAGAVFCGSTLPLAALGSKPVTIQLGEKPIFVGAVEEFAAPYLGLATAMSVGVGVVSLAAAGWRQSSRKLSLAEEQMSTLKQQLNEKAVLIEGLKFSEARLATSGLDGFLEDEARPQPLSTVGLSQPIDQPQASAKMTIAAPSVQQPAATYQVANYVVSEPAATYQTKNQAATALASAQAFMGFARPKSSEAASSTLSHQPENGVQLDELLSHLKQVMTQIETLHIAPSATQERAVPTSTAWQQQQLAS